jgi:SAM-dependent methyltransferase
VVRELAQRYVDNALAHGGTVLEAGCGSASHIDLSAATRIVGVDISRAQLERNPLLDERIQADLQTARLDIRADAVISWDVLEHLEQPLAAVDNLVAALKPGGVLVIGVPNVRSLKARLAKLTPHWVHERTFRWLYPRHPTGEDVGPFPTVLAREIDPQRLARYLRESGVRVLDVVRYESEAQVRARRRIGLTGARWRFVCSMLRVLRVDASESEMLLIAALVQQRDLRDRGHHAVRHP